MTSTRDSRPVGVPYRFDRAVVRASPRRFRLRYREELMLAIWDCCQRAHRERGPLGLIPVWGDALFDLGGNSPHDRVTRLVEQTDAVGVIRYSCSGCYNDLEPDWPVRKIRSELLVEEATHVTGVHGHLPSFAPDLKHFIAHVQEGPPDGLS